MTRSADLFARALKVLPGGVSRDTILRAPHPIYAAHASGYTITSVDGKQYVDFVNNMASLLHGHAFPPITDAVGKQLALGTSYSVGTVAEIEFAEHLCTRAPTMEKVRFMNSGTEAVMAAVRAARAYTGRPKIAKVEGAYHGAYDYVEVSQTSGPDRWGPEDRPASVPLAAGTPKGVINDVVVIPFNKPELAKKILGEHTTSIAAVLIDPIPHRVGLMPASDEFVRFLREWTSANGSILIFDEVITFRTEVGGAQARYDVKPDLTALGKAIGGGFPVGAVAGRSELMSVFATSNGTLRLPQSGTFSANPVTMTAGLVAMQHFGQQAVHELNERGALARKGIIEAIRLSGVPASVTGAGSMFRIHLHATAPDDYRSAYLDSSAKARLNLFVNLLLDHGILIANTGTGMLSTAMRNEQIDQLAEAVYQSLYQLPSGLCE
jgi:glutamate-1-semialdehyde 2,1-aminomutase